MKAMMVVLVAMGVSACGYGKPACTIVDAAAAACTVVRYMDKNGVVHEVPVAASDLAGFAQAAETKQEAARAASSAK